MANEQERVILTVEARDMLTAPLQAMNRSMDTTASAVTASAARQATGVRRAMEQINGSLNRATGTSQTMERAMNQATTSVADTAGASARRIDQRFMQTITTQYGRLRDFVRRNSEDIASSWDFVSSRASAVGSAIGGFLQDAALNSAKAVGIAAGIVGGVAAKAMSGGLNRQMNIEDAQAKLVGLGSSAQDVEAIMASAMDSVKGTAFGLDSAATIAATAVASGIAPGKELTKYLSLVGDASTIAGTGLDEMGQIMGKVTNAGKVTNEVIQQFGDRGVGVLQMLAKEYGVTADEMTDMISKSKVDAATFTRVLEENIGGAALKSGNTTRGAMANMGAALSRVGVTLTMGFFPLMTKGYNAITETLDGMNKMIKPAGQAFATWFGGVAGPVVENFSKNALYAFGEIIGGIRAFGAAWNSTEDDITSSGFPGFMEHLANGARKVKDAAQKLNPYLDSMKTIVMPLAGSILALSSRFLSFIPILGPLLPALSPVLGILLGLLAASPELRAALGDMFMTLIPVVGQMAAAMTPVVVVFSQLVEQAALLVAWLIDKLNPALPVLVPLIIGVAMAVKVAQTAMVLWKGAVMAWTGAQVGWQMAMGTSTALTHAQASATERAARGYVFMRGAQIIGTAVTWAQVAATTALAIATNAAVWPVLLVVAAIGMLVAGFIWAYNNVEWFRDGVNAALDWIVAAFHNVVAWWNDSFVPGLKAVGQWFVDVFQAVADFLAPVFAWIGDVIDGAVSLWQDIIQGIVDFWNGVLFPIIEKIGSVFAAIFGWVQRLVWNAMTIVMAIFWALVDLWNGVLKPGLDLLAEWFGTVMAAIGILIGMYVQKWVDFFGMIVDFWNGILYPAIEWLWQGFMTVLGWIGDAIGWYIGLWVGFFGMLIDFWNGVLFPILQTVGTWFADVFNWIYTNVIEPVINWIVDKFNILVAFWNIILKPIVDKVAEWFQDKIGGAISSVTGFIEDAQAGFNILIGFWKEKLSPIVETMQESFRILGDLIGGAVQGVKDFAANPLGGIQDWLGIQKDGNGQGVMPTRNSGGGVYPGGGVHFAGGGVLGGYAPGRDTIPAMLSPGESVLVPELTRALGPANIMAANYAASGGRAAGSGPSRAAAAVAMPSPSGGGGGGNTTVFKIEAGAITMAFDGDASEITPEIVRDAIEEVIREIQERGY